MERVRRLLAIANDPAASDNEQRIALEQAQRLMDKHAIEEWQLEENHDDVEIIKRRIRLNANPCNRYMVELANIVARGNRCRASYGCRRAGNGRDVISAITIYGTRGDVDKTEAIWTAMETSRAAMWRERARATPHAKANAAWRNGYYRGFQEEIARRYQVLRLEMESDGTGKELVTVRSGQVDQWIETHVTFITDKPKLPKTTRPMYWDRYIHRDNPRRIEPLDKSLDMYVMLDTETTGLHPEEGATLIEIGAFLVQPGNENSRPKFEQLIDPRQPLSEFITGLTGITDQMLQGMPTAGAAMLRFHQWLDQVWPAGEPLTIIAHNAEFDVSFLDAAERVYDPTASGFYCRWLCTKEMSWELNPQKRHHRVTDLIADYHIGDTEEHRALADAIQEQMIYRALCHEATMRGKWIGQ